MSKQLVLYIGHFEDQYRWCWRSEDGNYSQALKGAIGALAADLGVGNHTALLIIGGTQVALRQLPYAAQEKKHLSKLLPYQLEEEVVGDIEQFHFALGAAKDGLVTLAYTENTKLRALFTELADIGVEVSQCIPATLLLPRAAANDDNTMIRQEADAWGLHLEASQVFVRHGAEQGFCVDGSNLAAALTLLLGAENRIDTLPTLNLSAPNEAQLEQLEALLPASLSDSATIKNCSELWQYAPDSNSINLCQGIFSQRLPIDRWWRNWQRIIILAGIALGVYIGVLLLAISGLEAQNLEVRKDIEATFRTVVPRGPANDPERRMKIMVRDLKPQGLSSQAVALLGDVLPKVNGNTDIILKSVYYTAASAELSLNIQASTFNAIETLRSNIEKVGLQAELLSSSAQGGNHSGRLKITRVSP